MNEHRCTALSRYRVACCCGWSEDEPRHGAFRHDLAQRFAEHYAMEMQAAKPRTRRGGEDRSEPTSAGHLATLDTLAYLHRVHGKDTRFSAARVHAHQVRGTYSPQRIRTCLAGLVRAGLVEEFKEDGMKYRLYRLTGN